VFGVSFYSPFRPLLHVNDVSLSLFELDNVSFFSYVRAMISFPFERTTELRDEAPDFPLPPPGHPSSIMSRMTVETVEVSIAARWYSMVPAPFLLLD